MCGSAKVTSKAGPLAVSKHVTTDPCRKPVEPVQKPEVMSHLLELCFLKSPAAGMSTSNNLSAHGVSCFHL